MGVPALIKETLINQKYFFIINSKNSKPQTVFSLPLRF